jgi:hydroxymethylpyrimidine/phosphomethylpyrimidine kinase
MTPAVALSIAGSDSGGGAGVQADLKTFAALGVFGTCALSAVTAQNTASVDAVVALEPAFVVAQVTSVLADLPVGAVKTGMLASGATVRAVAALASAGRLPNLVVDPVLVSSTGHPLMTEDGVEAYREHLLPHALVTTPNLYEAAVLTGRRIGELRSVEAMADAAREIAGLGARFVVVKGGHLPEALADAGERTQPERAPDVVVGPDGAARTITSGWIPTRNIHGTGCSLASAIAALLARGSDVAEAIDRAKAYVHDAIAGARTWELGAGHGPIDHFGWSRSTSEEPFPATPSNRPARTDPHG